MVETAVEPAEGEAYPTSLPGLALLFLRLGSTSFGGPAAHIAMMEDEVVRRRRWMTHEEFLDLLGATNLIPGPNSTEMAIHIGHRQRGWVGLLVAGVCFILPAVLIVTAVAWVYVRYGSLPQQQFPTTRPLLLDSRYSNHNAHVFSIYLRFQKGKKVE